MIASSFRNRPAAAPVHGTAPRICRRAPRDLVAHAFGIGVFEFMPGMGRRNVREPETTLPCRGGAHGLGKETVKARAVPARA
ncbi:hypothetical protein [Burkholderia territorii]|uniref:hypothetical protein n=1 Tax=Burkholderia territorii TaxID=1503055 RepID=UPI0007B98927|nr:hypothetical protein [Burkholderia territorii]